MRIVIIDDEVDICFILAFEIQSLGHSVAQFHSAIEAKEFFEKEDADLVICDFQMPKFSGLDFFNWLKSKNKNIPFIVLTGESHMDTEELLHLGIADILYKPQDLRRLEEILNKISRA